MGDFTLWFHVEVKEHKKQNKTLWYLRAKEQSSSPPPLALLPSGISETDGIEPLKSSFPQTHLDQLTHKDIRW